MKEIIWKDKNILRLITILLFCILLDGYILFVVIKNWRDVYTNISAIVLFTLGILLSVYSVITYFMPKSTFISKTGIRVGNIIDDNYNFNPFTFKKESLFLTWSEIKDMQLIQKKVYRKFHSDLEYFLVVHSKNGKKYETFIYNPEGFAKNLKNLNKSSLLVYEKENNEKLKNEHDKNTAYFLIPVLILGVTFGVITHNYLYALFGAMIGWLIGYVLKIIFNKTIIKKKDKVK